MLDSSCHPPLPPAGAYRFAPDPISKRKRKKIAENPQDKPLRAVVRCAILGVSPSDILGFSVSQRSNLRRSQCADVALRDGTRVEGPQRLEDGEGVGVLDRPGVVISFTLSNSEQVTWPSQQV